MEKRLRVLVIDDNAAQCLGLAELLQIDGFTTYTALDATRGLYLARTLRPDAILLDVNMPDMDGFELSRQLRADPLTANTAIIFHSAEQKPRDIHGADSFLSYPVPLSIITSVLRACVERRQKSADSGFHPIARVA